MFKSEITLDDVIEFIIRNRNNREYMDEISKTSFPFTTKYLEGKKQKDDWSKTITLTPTVPPYGGGVTYCSSNNDDITQE